MKKRTLKSLSLNKNSISNFSSNVILGQGPRTVTPDCYYKFTYDKLCMQFTANNDCFPETEMNCPNTDGCDTTDTH